MTMEKLRRPPPEKISNNPSNWLLLSNDRKSDRPIPGIGMWARILVATNNAATIKIRLRSSLTFQICEIRDIGYEILPPAFSILDFADSDTITFSRLRA